MERDNERSEGTPRKVAAFVVLPLFRTCLVWAVVCSALANTSMLISLLSGGTLVPRSSLSPIAAAVLFLFIMFIDVIIRAQQRLYVLTDGKEGFPVMKMILGYELKVHSAVELSAFILAFTILYSTRAFNTNSASTSSDLSSSKSQTHAPAQPLADGSKVRPIKKLDRTPDQTFEGHRVSVIDLPKLSHLCDGLTTLRCTETENAFGTRWIEWAGKVTDIDSANELQMMVKFPDSSDPAGELVIPTFQDSEVSKIAQVRLGDNIVIGGSISEPVPFGVDNAILIRNVTAESRR